MTALLISTAQKSCLLNLDNLKLNVNCQGEPLERVQSTRLLGVLFDEHVTWNEHITKLLALCHGALSVLRKLKNLTPFHVRKLQLVESLVLSKLDYACIVYHPLPDYQVKRLQ